jgi:hypothetical protein
MPRPLTPRFVQAEAGVHVRSCRRVCCAEPERDYQNADDPIVRARPELFMPLEASRQRPMVEQATAAPGELR